MLLLFLNFHLDLQNVCAIFCFIFQLRYNHNSIEMVFGHAQRDFLHTNEQRSTTHLNNKREKYWRKICRPHRIVMWTNGLNWCHMTQYMYIYREYLDILWMKEVKKSYRFFYTLHSNQVYRYTFNQTLTNCCAYEERESKVRRRKRIQETVAKKTTLPQQSSAEYDLLYFIL